MFPYNKWMNKKLHLLKCIFSRGCLITRLEIKWEQLIYVVRSQFSDNHWGVQDCGTLVALLDARKFCFLIRCLINVSVHCVEIY